MKRREFIGWLGVGGVVSSLPVVVSGCGQTATNTGTAAPVRPDGFQVVGPVSALDSPSGLLNKTLAQPVLVIRDPANANTLTAVNPTCPHEGCTVDWKSDSQTFVCPCHDAKFTEAGALVQGPAEKPLTTYTAKIEGDSVLVNFG